MVSKIRLGYEGKFYDAFDVTFYDEETGSLLTRRAVDKRLDEKLFGPMEIMLTKQHRPLMKRFSISFQMRKCRNHWMTLSA